MSDTTVARLQPYFEEMEEESRALLMIIVNAIAKSSKTGTIDNEDIAVIAEAVPKLVHSGFNKGQKLIMEITRDKMVQL